MELELAKDQEEPKHIRAAQSPFYRPAVALEFFRSVGRSESFPRGKPIFVEEEGRASMVSEGARMYLLLDGEVTLSVGKKAIGTIGKGEIFGEIASISQLPRSATAVARTDCSVISLDEGQFQSAAAKSPEFALMLMSIVIGRLLETVARLTSGGALSAKDRWNRAAVFERKVLADLERELEDKGPTSHPANKVIMKEGEKGLFTYVVREGVVAITIQDKLVEKIGPGGIFGEMALLNQNPRVATATAETDCSLLAINRNEFMNLVRAKPAFATSLLKGLAHRLRFMTSKYK